MGSILVRVLWLTATVAVSLQGPVQALAQGPVETSSSLTGSYLHDARPVGLMFLSVTQSGDQVSGFFVLAQRDTGSPNGGDIATRELTVSGTTDGTGVTLVVGDSLSGQFTMTGSRQERDLILSYSTNGGGIETAAFVLSSPDAFNSALADWQAGINAEAELRQLLPTEADMPTGLAQVNEYGLTREEVVAAYPELEDGRLTEWGWQASVARMFSSSEGSVPSDHLISTMVYLHRFNDPEAAGVALATFAAADDIGGWEVVEADPSGHQAQVLATPAGPQPPAEGWKEIEVYARTGSIVVRVVGMAFQSDPTEDTLEVTRRAMDPTYAAAARELARYVAELNETTRQIDESILEVRGGLDGVQEAVGSIQMELDELRTEAAVRPMGCVQITNVEVGYTDLELAESNLELDSFDLDPDLTDLDAAVTATEGTVALAQETLQTLDTALKAMVPPLTSDGATVFADEQSAITAYEQLAMSAREDVSGFQADYAVALTTADDLMAEGRSVVAESQELATC